MGRSVSSFLAVLLLLGGVCTLARAASSPRSVTSCPVKMRHVTFTLQQNGTIAETGATQEGSTCVEVIYDPFRFDLVVSTNSTTTKGTDLSNVLLTGALPATPPGGGSIKDITDKVTSIATLNQQRTKMLQDVAKTVADLQAFLPTEEASLRGGNTKQGLDVATAGYETTLYDDFFAVQNVPAKFPASDMNGGSCVSALSSPTPGSLSFQIAAIQTEIAALTKTDTDALTAANAAKDSATATAKQAELDSLATETQLLNGYAATADAYKCQGAGAQALTANLSLIQFWQSRFQSLGFGYDPAAPLPTKPTVAIFSNDHVVSCGGLFNQTVTSVFSVSATDQAPTLLSAKATSSSGAQSFYTVTCTTPIAVSGGVEVSGIRDQEYQIVKSAPPAGSTTSVSKFGYTNNSPVHLLPIVMAHARLGEYANGKVAVHMSVGVSGNLQGQSSGGSSAEFLIGPSLSLFRTMFFTAGVHIGYQSQLAGGFNVGDTVPTDITAPQVYKSALVRYGIAVTFGKP